jgi:hypothetical protein
LRLGLESGFGIPAARSFHDLTHVIFHVHVAGPSSSGQPTKGGVPEGGIPT